MPFSLAEVVPWGRSYEEYLAMFSLSPADLRQRILGCGDGPAGFNSRHNGRGGKIVSLDPLYAFSAEQIRERIAATFTTVLEQTARNSEEFRWDVIHSVAELGRVRMAAMTEFLRDFEQGRAAGRYLAGALPMLPWQKREFGLALCSHLLFLYSGQLSEEFHVAAIRELCRVAHEARIFPLLELGAKRSRHLDRVMAQLEQERYQLAVSRVAYEFQKGGNEMLVVRPPSFLD
ncbi:MAG: SAM-dependent methyltransferase [Desulfurivibrio sp.]|nr:MAG: SAM-dependent methyltransferase [Desulfurivibrio sp.]